MNIVKWMKIVASIIVIRNGKSKMESRNSFNPMRTFQDLHVYQNLFKAMIIVHTKIICRLPKEEQFDLVSQMRRSSKAATALLAEGFAKRYHRRHWQKYLHDTMGESNEMIHHLSVVLSIYNSYVNQVLCKETIDLYDKSCRQLTKLANSWKDFHEEK